MMWFRRIAAVPLFLLAFVCVIGAIRIFAKDLPGSGVGEGVFAAFVAAAAGGGLYFLIRPDLQRLRGLSMAQIRRWIFRNPLGQAALLYAAAALIMLAVPKYPLPAGLLAVCVFSVLSARTAVGARSWWAHAGLAVLGFVLLLFGLAGTAEALTKGGFGEGGMLFLLPMYGFPILLALSGIVRLVRGSRAKA
jgi:hypothetical protein